MSHAVDLSLAKASVLLIDDDPQSGALVERILGREGVGSFVAAPDGESGMNLFRARQPHVVLLDLSMPGLDGFGVLEQLHEEAEEACSSLLVLTGHDDPVRRISALRLGARDFIAKPFNPPELVARVRNAFEVQELCRHLRHENDRLEEAVRRRTQRLEAAVEVLRQTEATLAQNFTRAEGESRAKDDMVVEASHDLRSPLNAICGYAEIIEQEQLGAIGDPRYREYAGNIHLAARHILAVVNDVLDLSRVQAGADQIERAEVSVGDVVRSTVELLRQQAKDAGIELAVTTPPDDLRIVTDETKLRRIILNLTSNAVKFTPSGGRVTVAVEPDLSGGAFVLVIRDTGIGIAPEDIPTALRPFGRVRGKGGVQQGAGLGLPLTKALVETLGGRFELNSRHGEGTCIRVQLPRVAPEPKPAPRGDEQKNQVKETGRASPFPGVRSRLSIFGGG
jgi:signal transduction histidine kinase